jgi:hypothetical protein
MRTITAVLKIFPAFIISSFILLITTGCQKTAIQYGQQYIDNGITNIILVDSIAPVVSTILKDSVITSQTGVLQVGSYADAYFGQTTANAYLQLAPPSLADVLNNAQFDSLVVLMKCNGSYYGDTTLPITIAVNQLSQEITLQTGQTTFSNSASFPINPVPLGTRTFGLRPLTGDSANIRVSDALGQDLFSMIRAKADIVKDNILFTNYLKGLNISATTNNNVFGMKDSVSMRLYYHQVDIGYENKFFDFTFYNKPLQFNHIVADRTGTPLTALTTQNLTTSELFSTASNNIGYLQPATGLYLKIAFPSIRALLERADFVKIIRADLIIKPIANSFSSLYPLPPVLNAFQTDGANEPGTAISSTTGGTAATETGNLFIDGLYGTNTTYTYDVTTYLTQEIAQSLNNKDGLLLLPPAGTRVSTMNRAVIGDVLNAKNTLKLNVYYISVNK